MLVLQALANLHPKMCSHGNLKPANIMVDLHHGGCSATLIDFALANFHLKGVCSCTWAGLANAQTVHVQGRELRPLRLLQAVAQPSIFAALAAQPDVKSLTVTSRLCGHMQCHRLLAAVLASLWLPVPCCAGTRRVPYHCKGTCMYTPPESFCSSESALPRFMQKPFYPYSADAWALAVLIAEVREWCTSGMPQVVPRSCGA